MNIWYFKDNNNLTSCYNNSLVAQLISDLLEKCIILVITIIILITYVLFIIINLANNDKNFPKFHPRNEIRDF